MRAKTYYRLHPSSASPSPIIPPCSASGGYALTEGLVWVSDIHVLGSFRGFGLAAQNSIKVLLILPSLSAIGQNSMLRRR